jgi:hypothetical protein
MSASAHGAGVLKHFVNRYLQRVFLAQHDHSKRIANKNDVHAGFVEQTRSRIVIRRQASDFL